MGILDGVWSFFKRTEPTENAQDSDEILTWLEESGADWIMKGKDSTGTVKAIGLSGVAPSFNEGVVKINGDSLGTPVPGLVLTASLEQQLILTPPLVISSATKWPPNIATPTDADVYLTATDKFLENPITNQVHTWRIIITSTRASGTSSEVVKYKLRNPISGFEIIDTKTFPKGETTMSAVFEALSIADAASIGVGYEFWFESSQDMTVTIDSVTRHSTHRD